MPSFPPSPVLNSTRMSVSSPIAYLNLHPPSSLAVKGIRDRAASPPHVQRDISTNSTANTYDWNVVDVNVTTLPPFYPPLEPSKSVFAPNVTPSKVAERISRWFRQNSVAAIHDTTKTTATARTFDNMVFCVKLFKGDQGKDGVIVEIEPLRGCSSVYFFLDYCRPLLRAATFPEERKGHPKQQNLTVFPPSVGRVNHLPDSISFPNKDEQHNMEKDDENAFVALANALSLLSKDRMDANKLGIESLLLLSNPQSTDNQTAFRTAVVVLLDDASDWIAHPELSAVGRTVHSFVYSCLVRKHFVLGFAAEHDFSEEEHPDMERLPEIVPPDDAEYMYCIRSLSLHILCNSLELLWTDQKDIICRSPFCTNQESIVSLLFDVDSVSRDINKAHNAALAARCLSLIMRVNAHEESQGCRKMLVCLKDSNAAYILQQAKDIGAQCHSALAKEAGQTLDLLVKYADQIHNAMA